MASWSQYTPSSKGPEILDDLIQSHQNYISGFLGPCIQLGIALPLFIQDFKEFVDSSERIQELTEGIGNIWI